MKAEISFGREGETRGAVVKLVPEQAHEQSTLHNFQEVLHPSLPKVVAMGITSGPPDGEILHVELSLVPGQGPIATHEKTLKGERCDKCGGPVQRTGRCKTCLACGDSTCG